MMQIVTTISDLKKQLSLAHINAYRVGFVPTMGALHQGHLSLVSRCVSENDYTVVSIFVNPTQFNDANDLANYPRDLERDLSLLASLHVDLVFAPSVSEVYPSPDTRTFSYPPIDTVMEGAKRPGHFNGVCQIVSKLFQWVSPTNAYFGEKDFQQIAVVRAMTNDLNLNVKIHSCPIVREDSGLAMSSRNSLLNNHERRVAAMIYATLQQSLSLSNCKSISEVHEFVVQALNEINELNVEYFEIVDGYTLQPVLSWEDSEYIVGCITVYCGTRPVRLIDNVTYRYNK